MFNLKNWCIPDLNPVPSVKNKIISLIAYKKPVNNYISDKTLVVMWKLCTDKALMLISKQPRREKLNGCKVKKEIIYKKI